MNIIDLFICFLPLIVDSIAQQGNQYNKWQYGTDLSRKWKYNDRSQLDKYTLQSQIGDVSFQVCFSFFALLYFPALLSKSAIHFLNSISKAVDDSELHSFMDGHSMDTRMHHIHKSGQSARQSNRRTYSPIPSHNSLIPRPRHVPISYK